MTSRMELHSPFLLWSGRNLFPIYMYQRIPMIIFSPICGGAFTNSRVIVWLLFSAIMTVVIALNYKYFRYPFYKRDNAV